MLDRAQAVELLKTYTTSEALIRHAYAVEACMRRFAVRYGEDENYWGLVGLLHDVDYDKWPEEHLKVAPELLEKAGFDGAFIRAVLAHGYGVCQHVHQWFTTSYTPGDEFNPPHSTCICLICAQTIKL